MESTLLKLKYYLVPPWHIVYLRLHDLYDQIDLMSYQFPMIRGKDEYFWMEDSIWPHDYIVRLFIKEKFLIERGT